MNPLIDEYLRCPKCGQVKRVTKFPKQRDRHTGLRYRITRHCRVCRNERRERRRALTPV